MTRSPSTDSKPSKRKGARSVSTLSPSQLARKRANDREAQRAIRARTKEHIEQLERELDALRSRRGRDKTVQDLLRRNEALEKELASLRDTLGLQSGRPLGSTSYDDKSSSSCSGSSSRAPSIGQGSADYSTTASFGTTPYIPAPDPREAWASVLPCAAVPSLVSSPASPSSTAEDYMAGYFPTSVPAGIVDGGVMPQPVLPCLDRPKPEYDDIESDSGYPHHAAATPRTPGSAYMPHHAWPLYGMYYPHSPAL